MFEETRCGRRAVPGAATQCGTVKVPVSPESDELMELSVVRVFTDSIRPEADPVIYLDGGPGVATLDSVQYMVELMRVLYPDRDLIYFDQRGVGRSGPQLTCSGRGSILDVLDRCYADLNSKVDLNTYRSVNSAHDVAAIVSAFGYETVNLLGISYGTRLALTVMREHPEIVRSSVLDSVVALQEDLFAETAASGFGALKAVFEACSTDVLCNVKYPDPYDQLKSLIERLNVNPIVAGDDYIDGNQFLNIIFQMMYSADLLGYVPYFIDTVDNGDTDLLESLFEYASDETGFSFGMHLSLQCAEEIAFSSREAFAEKDAQVEDPFRGALSSAIYLDYCEHWPVDKAPAIENEPVESSLPTLVLTGRFDPITPPKFALAAFDHLSAAQFFLLSSESHGASLSACGGVLVRSFTDNPRGTVEANCALDPGLEFQSRSSSAKGRELGGPVKWQIHAPSPSEIDQALSQARIRRKVVRR